MEPIEPMLMIVPLAFMRRGANLCVTDKTPKMLVSKRVLAVSMLVSRIVELYTDLRCQSSLERGSNEIVDYVYLGRHY